MMSEYSSTRRSGRRVRVNLRIAIRVKMLGLSDILESSRWTSISRASAAAASSAFFSSGACTAPNHRRRKRATSGRDMGWST